MKKGYSKRRLETQSRLAEVESELATINQAETASTMWDRLQALTPSGDLIQIPKPSIPVVLVLVKAAYMKEEDKLIKELAAMEGGA